MRVESNGLENRKTIEKINENKSLFFRKIDKTDKLPSRLIIKTERTQIINMKIER